MGPGKEEGTGRRTLIPPHCLILLDNSRSGECRVKLFLKDSYPPPWQVPFSSSSSGQGAGLGICTGCSLVCTGLPRAAAPASISRRTLTRGESGTLGRENGVTHWQMMVRYNPLLLSLNALLPSRARHHDPTLSSHAISKASRKWTAGWWRGRG